MFEIRAAGKHHELMYDICHPPKDFMVCRCISEAYCIPLNKVTIVRSYVCKREKGNITRPDAGPNNFLFAVR